VIMAPLSTLGTPGGVLNVRAVRKHFNRAAVQGGPSLFQIDIRRSLRTVCRQHDGVVVQGRRKKPLPLPACHPDRKAFATHRDLAGTQDRRWDRHRDRQCEYLCAQRDEKTTQTFFLSFWGNAKKQRTPMEHTNIRLSRKPSNNNDPSVFSSQLAYVDLVALPAKARQSRHLWSAIPRRRCLPAYGEQFPDHPNP